MSLRVNSLTHNFIYVLVCLWMDRQTNSDSDCTHTHNVSRSLQCRREAQTLSCVHASSIIF